MSDKIVVCSDIDGVLIFGNNERNEDGWRAMRHIQEHGHDCTVITGRNYSRTKQAMRDFQLSMDAVILNGAVVVDLEREVERSRIFFSPDEIELIRVLLSEQEVEYALLSTPDSLWQSKVLQHGTLPPYREGFLNITVDVGKFMDWLAKASHMVVAPRKGGSLDIPEQLVYDRGLDALHVFPAAANKGKHVRELVTSGLYSQVAVIGDSHTDVSMFQVKGVYRIAVGNSCDELCSLADEVIAPHEIYARIKNLLA